MNYLIKKLIENEVAEGKTEAISIIHLMRQEINNGEDIYDVLSEYDLDLDDFVYLL
jgi:hypothetical protein